MPKLPKIPKPPKFKNIKPNTLLRGAYAGAKKTLTSSIQQAYRKPNRKEYTKLPIRQRTLSKERQKRIAEDEKEDEKVLQWFYLVIGLAVLIFIVYAIVVAVSI